MSNDRLHLKYDGVGHVALTFFNLFEEKSCLSRLKNYNIISLTWFYTTCKQTHKENVIEHIRLKVIVDRCSFAFQTFTIPFLTITAIDVYLLRVEATLKP